MNNKFFWGSATSSHQVEGNNRNNWSEWERENAERLSKASKDKYPPENYVSGRACDHYNRFRDDFEISKSLGHNAHRFSIEWSRVEPEEGRFDEYEITHYREVIHALREQGLEPFVTLWHWTEPLWFRDRGGWLADDAPQIFKRYAERMVRAYPDIIFWITENETNVYTGHGYWKGAWPPGIRSLKKYVLANHHLSRAHIAAYHAIKKLNPQAQVGITHNVIWFTRFPAGLKRYFWNRFFLRSIRKSQDFVGLNYYFSDRDKSEKSDMGWSIDPDGFYRVIKDASRYKKPLYILENGIADATDAKRAQFIKSHIEAMRRAIREGVDVRGYFYWSHLDNFEWDKGFWPRFGLVEIDYKTLERKVRPSAYEYKKIIENAG